MPPVKLHAFRSGFLVCRVDVLACARPLPYRIPVPWYFVEAGDRGIVIDGGMAAECARDAARHWGAAAVAEYEPVITPDEACRPALAAAGIAPERVTHVVQSHLHNDHTGAVGRFPGAVHIVHRAELAYARAPLPEDRTAYAPADILRPGVVWRELDGPIGSLFDLFGDGSVTLIATPGHSPGHLSVLVRPSGTRPVLLTIDAAYTRRHFEAEAVGALMPNAEALASLAILREIARNTGADVVFGHSPEEEEAAGQR